MFLICSLLAMKNPSNVLYPCVGLVPLKDAHPLHEERVGARFLAEAAGQSFAKVALLASTKESWDF
jgi:hypothetical protein